MDVGIDWQEHQPPPVSVRTPYTSGVSWSPTAWVRDAEAQTLSPCDLVKEVLVNMVVDGLKHKGLPLIACSHTRGLQLENIINGIVDSHLVMCSSPASQHQGSHGDRTEVDNNDENWELQQASQILEEFTAFTKSKRNPSLTAACKAEKPKKREKKAAPRTAGKHSDGTPKPRKPIQRAPSGTMYRCDQCDKQFTQQKHLIKHYAKHSLNRPFMCDMCEKRFKTNSECQKHVKMIHLNKYPYYCAICGKGIASARKKIEHENIHLNDEDKPIKCKYCNKGFPSHKRLEEHLRSHEDDKKYKCNLCSAKFVSYSSGYKHHLKLVHKVFISQEENRCLVCDKDMSDRHELMEHMKGNHSDVGIKCDECDVMFRNKQTLETHVKKEHMESPGKINLRYRIQEVGFSMGQCVEQRFFICEFCGGLFTNKSTLAKHMPVHEDNETTLTAEEISSIVTAHQQIARIRGRLVTDDSQPESLPPSRVIPYNISLPGQPNSSKPQRRSRKRSINSGMGFNTEHSQPSPKQAKKSFGNNTTRTEMLEIKKENQTVERVVQSTPKAAKRVVNKFDKNNQSALKKGSKQNKEAVKKPNESTKKTASSLKKPQKVQEAFTIYTKSPDEVAEMLLKGKMKLSLKVPIPGVPKSSSPSTNTNVSSAGDSTSLKTVSAHKDVQISKLTEQGTSTTESMEKQSVGATAPFKILLSREATKQSSGLPTSNPQIGEVLESLVTEQREESQQLQLIHTKPGQETAAETTDAERSSTEEKEKSSFSSVDESTKSSTSSKEPLNACTSSPDETHMLEMIKSGELKVMISEKDKDSV